MNDKEGMHALLEEVFSDPETEALRVSIRAACSRELELRRRSRALRWLVGAAAAAVLVAVLRLFVHTGAGPLEEPPRLEESPSYLVATRPLPQGLIVSTKPMEGESFLVRTDATAPMTQGALLAAVVRTRPLDPTILLTDGELLAMFGGAPCGLTKAPDGGKRFFFLRPEDEERFFW